LYSDVLRTWTTGDSCFCRWHVHHVTFRFHTMVFWQNLESDCHMLDGR